jgi:thiosulfate dehydrogenase [quinone] large subunit
MRTSTATTAPAARRQRTNGWPVLPLRIFLAALFGFAGYAKLSYPGFFDPASPTGLAKIMQSAKDSGVPIGRALQPLIDHSSFFGHLTAFAEIAVGLGLLVGLLTRLAALGGMALVGLIVLSVNWPGVREYTASSGWFTSVDLAVGAALSVFVLGGSDALSLDAAIGAIRRRRQGAEDSEPGFRDNETEESRRRLQGDPALPSRPEPFDRPQPYSRPEPAGHPGSATQQLPVSSSTSGHTDPDPDPHSLWKPGGSDTEN